MITDALLNLLFGPVLLVLEQLPPPPAWMTNLADEVVGGVALMVEKIAYLDPLIPYVSIGWAMGILVAAIGLAVGFQAVRLLLSLFTGGGGAI